LYKAPAIEHKAFPPTMGGEPPRAIKHPVVIGLDGLRAPVSVVGEVLCGVRATHKCLAFCKFCVNFGQCPSPSRFTPHLLCLRNARAFPLLPAALASVSFGFVLVRVRVRYGQGQPTTENSVPSTCPEKTGYTPVGT